MAINALSSSPHPTQDVGGWLRPRRALLSRARSAGVSRHRVGSYFNPARRRSRSASRCRRSNDSRGRASSRRRGAPIGSCAWSSRSRLRSSRFYCRGRSNHRCPSPRCGRRSNHAVDLGRRSAVVSSPRARVATCSNVRYREGGACVSAGAATSAGLTACSRKWLDRALNRIRTSEPRVSSRPTISAALSPRRGDTRLTRTREEVGAVVISGCTQAFPWLL